MFVHIERNNTLKQGRLPGDKIKRSKIYNYTKIIQRLFPPRGRGVDYVHWNDPNELMERLRLLIGSKRTGHTRHDNEIFSIVEELREADIVL